MESDEHSSNNVKYGGGSTGGSDIDDDDSLNDYTSSNNSIKKFNNKNCSGSSSSNNSKNCINSNLYEIDNNNHNKDLNYNIMDNSKTGIDDVTLLENNNTTALRLQTITLSDDDDFGEHLIYFLADMCEKISMRY